MAVSTLGQAEVFSQHGFSDILITNLMVTRPKLSRAAALGRRIKLAVLTDSTDNVTALSDAAKSAGSNLGVAVAVRSEGSTFGATPSEVADLSARISSSSSLDFAGLVGTSDLGPLLEAVENCRASDIHVPAVTAGGSATYDSTAATDGVTEVIAGSYAANDNSLASRRPELQRAARILATVISSKDQGLVWVDAGQKATSIDTGLPAVDNVDGVVVPRMSAEHGAIVNEAGNGWDLDVGSKVWLVPDNIANTANVYDYIHATRDGLLEAVWEVSARGRYN